MSKFNSLIHDNLVEYVKANSDFSRSTRTITPFKSKQNNQITQIENLFIKNVLNKINKQSSLAIRKYIDKIKQKNKDVLKQIDNDAGFNFNLNLMGELELLQNRGFKLGVQKGLLELKSQFSSDLDLASFAKVNESNLIDNPDEGTLSSKATELPRRISKVNDNIDIVSTGETVESIRYYDITEKLKTTENLNKYTNNLFYESKDFRDEYLQKRNLNIAQNFTNKYKENIKKQIGDYIDKGTDITREKDLVEILTGQRVKLPSEPSLKQLENRKTQGLTKEVIGDPQAYQDLYKGDLYKFSPNARVERIAKTELPVAYNLGSLNVFLDYGYDTFRIANDDLVDNCVLCVSLQVKTKDPNNYITLADLASINYNPGSTNFYGIDFRNIDTKKRWNESPNSSQRILAPVFHPNCYCRIIPVRKQSKKKLDEKKEQKLNAAKNKNLVMNTVNVLGKISTAVTVHNAIYNTLNEIALQQELKEEENKKNLYKALIAGTSIISMGAMYFYFYKNYLKTLDDNISSQLSTIVVQEGLSPIQKTQTLLEIQEAIEPIPKNILNKTEETLNSLGAKKPTTKYAPNLSYNERLKEFNNLYKQLNQVLKGDVSRLSKQVNDLEANRTNYTADEFDVLKNDIRNNIEIVLAKVDKLDVKVQELYEELYLDPNATKRKQLQSTYNKYSTTIENSIRNKINKLLDKVNYIYRFGTALYNIVEFKKNI